MTGSEIDTLLAHAIPKTPAGVDVLLDIRENLKERGHPGQCVGCFFSLLKDMHSPEGLRPLRIWLEENLEIAVRVDGEEAEFLPVMLGKSRSLREYCEKAIELIRLDRAYDAQRIHLSFRYRQQAA
ncbi:MAG: hypothetical protein Q7Q71_14355 [Verrucomicrobiota bacterium JB023]|nr:hypothetical protein [Verrucomicrobiota bacterium JB023]